MIGYKLAHTQQELTPAQEHFLLKGYEVAYQKQQAGTPEEAEKQGDLTALKSITKDRLKKGG